MGGRAGEDAWRPGGVSKPGRAYSTRSVTLVGAGVTLVGAGFPALSEVEGSQRLQVLSVTAVP